MKTKQSPVKTDYRKRYCKYCGTFTISRRGCININHFFNKEIKQYRRENEKEKL